MAQIDFRKHYEFLRGMHPSDFSRTVEFYEACECDEWKIREKDPRYAYAYFQVIGCSYENWWYYDFIGVTFFGRIPLWKIEKKIEIEEVNPCVIVGKKRISVTYRTVRMKDLIMV